MRKIVGIIGSAFPRPGDPMFEFAKKLGNELVSAGYRIVCGGLGGVMKAAAWGAMMSENYFESSVICIIPSSDKSSANEFCDLIIPTGLGINRNTIIINTADILIAIGGGAGTLAEMALAWQYYKTILAVNKFGGWAKKLAGTTIDDRNAQPVVTVKSIEEIMDYLKKF